MIDEIFAQTATLYRQGTFPEKTTYYFSIGDTKKTVTFERDQVSVIDGKGTADADCVCKIGNELFLKIWHDGYRPGVMDFMSGAVKSNAPQLLQKFLSAFGK